MSLFELGILTAKRSWLRCAMFGWQSATKSISNLKGCYKSGVLNQAQMPRRICWLKTMSFPFHYTTRFFSAPVLRSSPGDELFLPRRRVPVSCRLVTLLPFCNTVLRNVCLPISWFWKFHAFLVSSHISLFTTYIISSQAFRHSHLAKVCFRFLFSCCGCWVSG